MRTKIAIGLLCIATVLAWVGTTMGGLFEQAFDPPSGRGPVEHAFAALGATYSREDDAAAWQRTTKMLSQYHPLRAQTATPAPKVQLPSGEAVAQHGSDDRNRVRPHKRFSILSHPHVGASPLWVTRRDDANNTRRVPS